MTNAAAENPVVSDYKTDAIELGRLILAAYDMSSDPSNLNPPLSALIPNDYQVLANVTMKDFLPGIDYAFYQFYGFLAVKKGTGEACIIIRGTDSTVEWIDDLYSVVPVPFFNYGKVGDAWAKIYSTMKTTPRSANVTSETMARMPTESFAAQVAGILREHVQTSQIATASVTVDCAGHSLGAALVTLYTMERRGEDAAFPIRRFYTFASPLVGDATFAASFNRQPFAKYRIFNNADPVPGLPPFTSFVPVQKPIELMLPAQYYSWALCSHSMDTYMNLLDPIYPPATACTSIIPAAAVGRAASVSPVAAASAPASVARPLEAVGTETRTVVYGGTKVTITIDIESK